MRIDGLFSGQGINLTGISDILSRLSVGDVIKAQILEMTSNELILKLFDGTTFKASSMVQLDAKKGDFVDFVVKNKSEGQIFIETVKNTDINGSSAESELKKQLASVGIKPGDQSIEIARQMKQYQVIFNKENFEKIFDLLVKYKELDPKKVTFLFANNMKIEEKNITDLASMMDSKLKVGPKLNELHEVLSSIKDQPLLDHIQKEILKHFPSAANDQTQSEVKIQGQPEVKIQGQGDLSPTSGKPVRVEEEQILKNVFDKEVNSIKDTSLKDLVEKNGIKEKLISFARSGQTAQGLNAGEDFQGKVTKYIQSQIPEFEKMPAVKQEGILEFVTGLATRFNEKRAAMNGLAAANEPDLSSLSKEEAAKSVIDKAFEHIFKKVNSGTLEKDIHPRELYKEIFHKLEIIRQSISASSVPSRDDIIQRVDDLENNLKLLNEINDHNTYVQIPLNIRDKNTTGELYVLKRDPKKKKIDPENVTVFISLNTGNLGQIDSLISFNKKNISIHMRVVDKQIFDFIKEGYKDLYNRLSAKGYRLVDLKYRLMEKKANLLNVNEVAERALEGNRVTIDYKL